MGQGLRTASALLVAENLGIPIADVEVVVGDTRVAPQHLTAGSWGTASALSAIDSGLVELRKHLDSPATGDVDVAAAVANSGGPRSRSRYRSSGSASRRRCKSAPRAASRSTPAPFTRTASRSAGPRISWRCEWNRPRGGSGCRAC
ncbi:molybdopterin-dependent oxidoreductase [Amycolatopsis sp. FDAARGOS 1241]|nr:molybdopterin-dependent oxidoreductase [Amycolatopsis sp. FDAARGOS 1241]